jgi:hypothetical protein
VKKTVTFEEAVSSSRDVRDFYRPGFQALLERDRNRLSCDAPREISGSLNLDAALARLYPNQSLWDYGIGIRKTASEDRAIWLEVHPAHAGEVRRMIAKLEWLKGWLQNHAQDLMRITEKSSPYIWVSSGGVSFQRNSHQARLLASAGIAFPCEHYGVKTQ